MNVDKQTEWFETWFNSPYYHILYHQRDGNEAKRFLRNLEQELPIKSDALILDVACGEGRFSRLLASRGHQVRGIDLAQENIAKANQLKDKHQQFVQHDMREPFPYLPNTFNYVFNFFTSFGYFKTQKEHQKTIENICRVLKHDGECIIDFMNVEKLKDSIQPTEIKKVDNITFHLTRSLKEGEVRKQIRITRPNQPSLNYEERVKAFTLSDFETLFSNVPIKICQLFGDYELHPFNPQYSERLIIRAKKSKTTGC